MGAMSADEQARLDMFPTWLALDVVRERDRQLMKFLHEELPGQPNPRVAAFTLTNEFNEDLWSHPIPEVWELVEADRAGQLTIRITELNRAFRHAGTDVASQG